jgi:hypothetical protein
LGIFIPKPLVKVDIHSLKGLPLVTLSFLDVYATNLSKTKIIKYLTNPGFSNIVEDTRNTERRLGFSEVT